MTPCHVVKRNDLPRGTGSTLLPNSVQFKKIKKSTQKMKTKISTATSVGIYQTTRHHIPEDLNLHPLSVYKDSLLP